MAKRRLTELSHGAGCACKISAAQLAPILDGLPSLADPRLIVDGSTMDDAAVYQLSEDLAIVQSVDFFTPIVDDPYDFGRIAAANALSDLYAMGARPVLALNISAFSLELLGADTVRAILRGGADIACSAGVAIGGGHSIDDPEPKYGLCVTGLAHPDEILTNSGGQPGDALHLTKPLGSGVITTAAKRRLASPDLVSEAIDVMTRLNSVESEAALAAGASAATDVTGFGLLGHLHELCLASNCAAVIDAATVPVIEGVLEMADDQRCRSGGTERNLQYAQRFTQSESALPSNLHAVLADATTSGGLLLAVADQKSTDEFGRPIGSLVEGDPGTIMIT